MAIKFNTSNLDDATYNTYDISEFNGVDYTTTPTNVDDTRAIDISNYLPEGSSLVKRHGWEHVLFVGNGTIKNIWQFKNFYVLFKKTESSNTEYGTIAIYNSSWAYRSGQSLGELVNENSWAFERDNRLFVLANNKYLMVYINDNSVDIEPVSNYAYIPTIAIWLQSTDSSSTSVASYEPFNMLINKAKITLAVNGSDFVESTSGNTYTYTYTKTYNVGGYFSNFGTYGLTVYDGDYNDTTYLSTTSGGQDLTGLNISVAYTYTLNTTTGELSVTLTYDSSTQISLSGWGTIGVEFIYNSSSADIVTGMSFGTFFGADNYRDIVFLSGNTDYPNMDIHNGIPLDSTIDNVYSYTYFPDTNFHKMGSSASAIVGYGVNSDSSLAIIKETVANEPNVYFRTGKYVTSTETITLSDNTTFTYNTAEMVFQVFPSAVNIKCDTTGQVIQYDNKVLINCVDGIYYINVNDSTSASSYDGVEVSYLIRNDLGKDISDSCWIVYDNKLFIARDNVDGTKRVYVCDKTRYTYKDNKLVYEWWVLDNIPAERFYVFDDELYFSRGHQLSKFTDDTFYDYDVYEFETITVGTDETITSGVYLDTDDQTVIISSDEQVIQECANASDPKTAYQEFRDNSSLCFVSFSNLFYSLNVSTWVLEDNKLTLFFSTEAKRTACEKMAQKAMDDNTPPFYYLREDYENYEGNPNYPLMSFMINVPVLSYAYDESREGYYGLVITTDLNYADDLEDEDTSRAAFYYVDNIQYSIGSLTNGTYDIEDCVYKDGEWIYIDEDNGVYEELGETYFNTLHLSFCGVPLEFIIDENGSSLGREVILYTQKPVSSYWLSKYNALGRLDFLKSATNIYFVPDARRGGYTKVGYRTHKKSTGYYSNSKSDTLDFNDINFDDFTFGQTEFGRTFSSKKKIKNFSFIQLKFSSDDEADSTLVSCSFRYKYSKNNKGVK